MYATERKNNFQFQLVGGKGITAYMTSIAGLGYDGYPTVNDQIDATPAGGGWLSYEYFFTPKLHSNIVFGYTYYDFKDIERFLLTDNDEIPELIVEGDLFNSHYYGIFNIMYEPFERVTVGLELDYGVKSIKWNGTINNNDIDNSQGRDAMRISFGFMFFI